MTCHYFINGRFDCIEKPPCYIIIVPTFRYFIIVVYTFSLLTHLINLRRATYKLINAVLLRGKVLFVRFVGVYVSGVQTRRFRRLPKNLESRAERDKNLERTGKKLHHLSRIAEPSKHRLVEVIDIVTFDHSKGGELEWIHASVIQ